MDRRWLDISKPSAGLRAATHHQDYLGMERAQAPSAAPQLVGSEDQALAEAVGDGAPSVSSSRRTLGLRILQMAEIAATLHLGQAILEELPGGQHS